MLHSYHNLPKNVLESIYFVTKKVSCLHYIYVTFLLLQPGITYSFVGYSDGPDYFNVSSTTGQIYVRSDLRLDNNKKTLHYVSTCCNLAISFHIFVS